MGRKSRKQPTEKRGRRRSEKRAQTSRRQPKASRGRVQKNPKGFAFLIPEVPGHTDLYVPPEVACRLFDGDIVEYTPRSFRGRTMAEVLRIVKRSRTELIGQLDQRRGKWFVAEGEGDPFLIEEPQKDLRRGDWVVARIDSFADEKNMGQASIVESMGRQLGPQHDISVAIARYSLPYAFSPRALEEAEGRRKAALSQMRQPDPRRDLRHLPFVTIDGPDAKDFDDAVLVEHPRQGPAFKLYVAIADVSFFVERGTELDQEARTRGTSVYFPGMCLPMLPESLSNDLCSLRPQEDKLSLVAEIHYDRTGHVIDSDFYEAVIRTVRRLTYDDVHEFFEKKIDLGPASVPMQLALPLYKKLLIQRKGRGVLDFDLPECKIEVDTNGSPIGVARAPRFESHKLIEEFMIAANQAVAKRLREGLAPTLYRVHESPEMEAVQEINDMLKRYGVSHKIDEISPREFSKILEATLGIKGAPTIHQAILRRQKQAKYEPEPKGHFGLALSDYAHFTSPIRRYPDLVVHRALKQLIYRRKFADWESEEVASLGQQTSDSERRAMEAERFVVRRKQCWFMEKHLGKEFDGTIVGMNSKGAFVEVTQYAIDGFLPLEALDGRYEFDEVHSVLRKRPGKEVIELGDAIKIQVVRSAPDEGKIEFSLPKIKT